MIIHYDRLRTKNRSGAAIVELAMILPFMAIALTLCLDFGRVFRTGQILQDAANVGVMYASGVVREGTELSREKAAIKQCKIAAQSLPSELHDEQIAVTFANNNATVTTRYSIEALFPVFGSKIDVSRKATLAIALSSGS